jgi:hypothetical protein
LPVSPIQWIRGSWNSTREERSIVRHCGVESGPEASADASGPDSTPRWHTIDKSSRVEFHDHRIHWMGETGKPAPQVTDASKRQKVVDWQVPIVVGGSPADIDGTLYWTPQEAGFPLPAALGLVAVLLLGGGLVLVVRRRRGPGTASAEDVW